MAKANTNKTEKQYTVTVENNPNFCGIGAGGVQFANGKATVDGERMANWFRKHKGYKVEEAAAPAPAAE
jgi:hypothetical protein